MWVKWAGGRRGKLHKMAELVTFAGSGGFASSSAALSPFHLWYLSHPFKWDVLGHYISRNFLGKVENFFLLLLNYPTESSQGKEDGREGWCERRVRTTCLAVRGWLPLLVGMYGCLSSAGSLSLALVYCIEAFSIFAHFSSGWLKLCEYFWGIFGLV